MLFDSHTHIQFPAYAPQGGATAGKPASSSREEVVKRAQFLGIKMICVGTQYSASYSAIELAEKYPNDIWATVGFHPSHVVGMLTLSNQNHAVEVPALSEPSTWLRPSRSE